MNKKKLILIIASLALLTALLVWVIQLNNNKGKSMSELIEFSIADTSIVDGITIKDPQGRTFELKREGKKWVDADGNCVVQEQVHSILEAAKNIEFKGYVTENSRKRYIELMGTLGIEVTYYADGDLLKKWYIGPSTQDHYGQVMLLETDDEKSDLPVLMKLKGFHGIIEPRFFADPRKWQCTDIMALPVSDIERVQYTDMEDPEKSFSVLHKGFEFQVKQNGRELAQVDTTRIFRYLNNFRKVNFEMPNYVLNDKQIDSLKRTKPFGILRVKPVNKPEMKMRFFRISGDSVYNSEFAEYVNFDMNKFWCELPDGEIVKCQYFVFDPLIRGDVYFNFDRRRYKNAKALGIQ